VSSCIVSSFGHPVHMLYAVCYIIIMLWATGNVDQILFVCSSFFFTLTVFTMRSSCFPSAYYVTTVWILPMSPNYPKYDDNYYNCYL